MLHQHINQRNVFEKKQILIWNQSHVLTWNRTWRAHWIWWVSHSNSEMSYCCLINKQLDVKSLSSVIWKTSNLVKLGWSNLNLILKCPLRPQAFLCLCISNFLFIELTRLNAVRLKSINKDQCGLVSVRNTNSDNFSGHSA